MLYDRSAPPESDTAVIARRYRAIIAAQAAAGVGSAFAARDLSDAGDLTVLTRVWMNSVSAIVSWWLENPDQTAEQMSARARRVLATVAQP